MFIKIKADETVNCDEAIINTDQITWINVKNRRIRLTDGSNLFVSKSELDKVIMTITKMVVIGG